MEILIENVAGRSQSGWVVAGLPLPLPDHQQGALWSSSDPGVDLAFGYGQELFVHCSLNGGVRKRVKLEQNLDGVPPPFIWHPDATDRVHDLMLCFALDVDGADMLSLPTPLVMTPDWEKHACFLRIESSNPARVRWHFRTQIAETQMPIEGWISFFSGQPWAEFEIRASYGMVMQGPRERTFGSLRLLTGEPLHIDWGTRKNLEPGFWSKKHNTYETEIAKPNQWFRCRTVEVFGAMMFERDLDAAFDDLHRSPSIPRIEGPLVAMLSRKHWQAHWSPTGAAPEPWPGARTEQERRWISMRSRLQLGSHEYEERPYAQPPDSGRTGEQPDFGCSRGEAVIGLEEPWAIYDLRYSVQAWLLRPYANREPFGFPVRAESHPGAQLYNLRPDERFGDDMLGWPKPVGWISGYTTSDSQHRSDNLLWAMWRLTRSPSLERTIRDMIELERMTMRRPVSPGGGVGAPRGWGRPLLSWCHGLQCGFLEFRPFIDWQLEQMDIGKDYALRPDAEVKVFSSREGKYGWVEPNGQLIRAEVKVFSSREGKYGWVEPNGQLIRAWVPWQDAIAVIGCYAAWRITADLRALEMARTVATSICQHAFFERVPGVFDHCYAIRWMDGRALTYQEYLNPMNTVRIGDCSYWTAAALRVLLAIEGNGPVADRARQILTGFTPNSWNKACWAAIA